MKWVVFVHYWITWVKTKLKGKGYKMSASTGPTTIPNFLDGITQDPVEFLASLFIDDSISVGHVDGPSDAGLARNPHSIFCVPRDKTSPNQIRTCLNQPRGNPTPSISEPTLKDRVRVFGKKAIMCLPMQTMGGLPNT